jgi:hypothetical protein
MRLILQFYGHNKTQEARRPLRGWSAFGAVLLGFVWCSVLSVSAETGSGVEQKTPLVIFSSSIENGEKDVEVDREIKLVFSENISSLSIKENNLTCFVMTDSKGLEIPFELILFDDQLEPEKWNNVILKPRSLRAGKRYTITVRKGLMAQNGTSLESDISIRFSTLGYVSDAESGRFPVVLIVPIVFLFISIAYFMNQKK